MTKPMRRLPALSAAAVLTLSPVVLATTAFADENLGYPAEPDIGYARNGGIPAPSEPDLGYARNGGVVVPEPAPTPAEPVSTGVDPETIALLAGSTVAALGFGVAGYIVIRRRHLTHPA